MEDMYFKIATDPKIKSKFYNAIFKLMFLIFILGCFLGAISAWVILK